MEKVRGIRVIPDREYNGNIYLHIKHVIRVFCFRDWFNTRLDLELRDDLFSSFMQHSNLKLFIKRALKMEEIPDIDFELIFLDLIKSKKRRRLEIERVDFWRRYYN